MDLLAVVLSIISIALVVSGLWLFVRRWRRFRAVTTPQTDRDPHTSDPAHHLDP